VAGPQVWNSLLAPLRDTNSIYSFRKQLKTFLFSGGYDCFLHVTNTLTYLITYLPYHIMTDV